MPAEQFFCDRPHYAAYLALLDGSERLRAAWCRTDADGKRFYAEYARRSLMRVEEYLAKSSVGRVVGSVCRPDYSREAILARAREMQVQAEVVLRKIGVRVSRLDVPFALVVTGGVPDGSLGGL